MNIASCASHQDFISRVLRIPGQGNGPTHAAREVQKVEVAMYVLHAAPCQHSRGEGEKGTWSKTLLVVLKRFVCCTLDICYTAHGLHLTLKSSYMASKTSMIHVCVCGLPDLASVIQALREHCSLSGHDPSRPAKPSKQKQGLAPVQPAVPLELTVDPIPDQVEMERCCDKYTLFVGGVACLE